MTFNDFIVLLSIHFIFSSLLPGINFILSILGMEKIVLTANFAIPISTVKQLFYPLIGYYLDHNIEIKKLTPVKITVLLMLAFGGILLSSGCTVIEGVFTGTYTQNYVQMFDYVTTICVFLIVKKIFSVVEFDQIFIKLILLIGNLSFGIYLLDPYLKLILLGKANRLLEPLFPTLIVSGIWVIITIFVGGGITFILKKIPWIRKLL